MNWSLHHVNLTAYDVKTSVEFFRDVIGMDGGRSRSEVHGNRANLKTDAYFFGEGTRGLHIVKPDLTAALKFNMPINPTVGGHVAIAVSDLAAVKRRLDARGNVYADPGSWAVPGMQQIYVCDPNMNVIEINQVIVS
jgi:catechol 2,3-dioxygenase-like lactoylglutathione lyase family enzyme